MGRPPRGISFAAWKPLGLRSRWEDVARLVLAGVAGRALAGVGIGVVTALGVTRILGGFLYGVAPTQPAVYVAAAAVLAGTMVLAAMLPVRRATRVDPVDALECA